MMRSAGLIFAALLFTLPSVSYSGPTANCKLDYPLVLSHHFGIRKICKDDWTASECARREPRAIATYCADWDDTTGCARWTLPSDEEHLPPRVVNASDPELVRTDAIFGYHRYFSKAIVDELETCGNQVYLSDKPAYASYQIRARSLRETVLQALKDSGSDKVVIIGHSQGVQDARLMTAALPVNDADPNGEQMREKVAAVVSLAGEHRGAESSSLLLMATYATNYLAGQGWGDYEAGRAGWEMVSSEEIARDAAWRLKGNATSQEALRQQPLVLTEGYDRTNPNEFDLNTDALYRTFLHAVTSLSRRYMGGTLSLDLRSWNDLKAYLGMEEGRWEDLVNAGNERCNGVRYFSYGARIRRWNSNQWGDGSTWYLMSALYGANDAYVSTDSQNFDRIGYWPCAGSWQDNFSHLKTLDGQLWGHGYHHMFFTGRNAGDAPVYDARESAPYNGDAADVYRQVITDLNVHGL